MSSDFFFDHQIREVLFGSTCQYRLSSAAVHQISVGALSRCHPAWASEGTPVGPGKDTHGPDSGKAVGGPS